MMWSTLGLWLNVFTVLAFNSFHFRNAYVAPVLCARLDAPTEM